MFTRIHHDVQALAYDFRWLSSKRADSQLYEYSSDVRVHTSPVHESDSNGINNMIASVVNTFQSNRIKATAHEVESPGLKLLPNGRNFT